jgi:CheY-like chemotaxis protein
VLMDLEMPEMDGLEATRLLRENEKTTNRHLPIIAITAHAVAGYREQCLAAGMDDYLSKPFELDQLLEIIDRLVPQAIG